MSEERTDPAPDELICSLRADLENLRLAAFLEAEAKNEEIAVMKEKYEGEIASLQRVLKEAVAETVRSTESDVLTLHRQNQWLEMQLRDVRNQLESNSQGDGGFVASLLKSIKLPSPHTNDHSPRGYPSNLSQEQLDQLKPIVLPFQQEIQKLKGHLAQQIRLNKEAQAKLFLYEKKLQVAGIIPDSTEDSPNGTDSNLSGPKLPVSRGDLEIYVAVLKTQKQVLQDDMREARQQLLTLRSLVGDSLKELSQLEVDDSAQLKEKLQKLEENFAKLMESPAESANGDGIRRSASNLNPADTKENDSAPARKSLSLTDLSDSDVVLRPGPSVGEMTNQRPPTLDISAVLDSREKSPTPSTSSLLSSLKEDVVKPLAACDMCDNYEQKLQQAQERERHLKQERDTLKALADRQKEEILKEREYRANLEIKTSSLADETTRDVSRMFQDVTKLQEELVSAKASCEETLSSAQRFVENAMLGREQVEKERDSIQVLYDKLLGKHRQLADQMRNEFIDLPESQEELQLLCLKLREELIDERSAKEHLDETLKSEVAFLRSQLDSAQHEKEQLEDSLTEEVNNLRTQLGVMQSKTNQIQEQLKLSQAKEEDLAACQTELEKLKGELNESKTASAKISDEKDDLQKRNRTLLEELNTSESVQKDFVLLSQNLQTQLEKIRQAEHEVRWQHEDDVTLCNGCRQPFHRGRRKQHCWHCGQIFCPTCIPKTVPSGPARRAVPVCDVCHTILERDTRPFFTTATDKKKEAD